MRDVMYRLTSLFGENLGFERVAAAGNVLGKVLWHAAPSRRRLAIEAVAFHLDKEPDEAARIAKASFSHNCRSFLESTLTRRVDWYFVRDRLSIENPEIMRAAQRDTRPAIIPTAHFGAWELQVGIMHMFLRHAPKHVVVRTLHDPALNAITIRQRTRPSISVIEHRNATYKVLKSLKKGGAVAFLVDHNCRHDEAVFLPFLNKVAAVNVGPALLGVRAGAVFWPAFMRRTEEGGYVVRWEEPLDAATLQGERDERIEAAASFYTRAVERQVRVWPEQWFWMHKRWKTRPRQGEGDTSSVAL